MKKKSFMQTKFMCAFKLNLQLVFLVRKKNKHIFLSQKLIKMNNFLIDVLSCKVNKNTD